MNGNSPELQAAYDELTAAIEKVTDITYQTPDGVRTMLGDYIVVTRIDMFEESGERNDGNVIIMRDDHVPLSNAMGLTRFAAARLDRRACLDPDDDED